MLHKILLAGVFCFSVGCMKIKKKDEQKNENQAGPADLVSESQTEQKQLDYEFLEDEQSVRFHFPSHWPQQVVVEKYKGKDKFLNQEILNLKGQWKDISDSKNKIGYKFFTKISDQLVLLDEIEIIPVLDLSLNEDYRLDEIYSIGDKVKKIQIRYLELGRNAKFFIGAFKGELQIEQLNSENGFIQTFPVGQRSTEKDGRNVGGFKLNIKSATGNLNLVLIGEAGAHGFKGKDPDQSLVGVTGGNGDPAQFTQRAYDPCAVSRSMCLVSRIFDCTTPPGRGLNGGKGLTGFSGGDGSRGGSIEKVDLQSTPSSLKIEVSKVVGAGGQGGEGGSGGLGGRGGQGGDGGSRDFLRFMKLNPDDPASAVQTFGTALDKTCTAAEEGLQGPEGAPGVRGRDGVDGIIF